MAYSNSRPYTSLLSNNDFKPGEYYSKPKKSSKQSVSSMDVNLDAKGVASRHMNAQAAHSKASQQPRIKLSKAEEDQLLRHVGSWTEDHRRAGGR